MLSAITGLPARDWVTIAIVAFALVLVACSLAVPAGGGIRRKNLLPAVAGVIMIGALIALSMLAPDLAQRLTSSPTAMLGAAGLAVVSFAIVDFLFVRVVPFIRALLARLRFPSSAAFHTALVVTLIPVVAASTLLAWRTTLSADATPLARLVGSVEEFALPGDPLGIAMVTGTIGYVTLGQGSVVRFELPAGRGQLRQSAVADGLEFPRGIVVADGRAYVVELGSLPCKPAYPTCLGEQVGVTAGDGERQILKAARGRISSYAIDAEGRLSDRRVVLSDLPVADSLHAVNGLAIGPDRNVYVAIGNFDSLWSDPTIAAGTTPHPDWMGTVLRVNPATGSAEVYARGLRNVYGLTFDDRGELWGVDNGGRAENERRAEEVLQIKQGHNYGYPVDGTFGVWTQRDDHPVWTIDAVGTAGVRWAGQASMQPGLFIGSCGGLNYLRLHDLHGRYSVQTTEVDAVQSTHLLDVPGCVTDIAAVGPQTILASVLAYGGGSKLLRITLSGNGA